MNFHRETGARKDGHYIPLSSALILVELKSNFSVIQVVTTMNEKSSSATEKIQCFRFSILLKHRAN